MILVTGASGNVGRELVRQLIQMGERVRVMTREPARVATLGASECVVADLDVPSSLPQALSGVRRAFLVTMGFGTAQDQAFVREAVRSGVEHVVRLSTIDATEAKLTIGKWHKEKDELLENSGLSWTVLRPGMFMSNALHWVSSIKGTGGVFFPGGKGRVVPIDPLDVARVAARVLTQPGHEQLRYELTGPELTSTEEMVATLARVLHRSLKYRDVPIFLAKFFMRRNGMDRRLAAAMGELALSLRRGEQSKQTTTVASLVGDAGATFEQWCERNRAALS